MSDIWHATPIRTLYVPDDGQGFVTVAQNRTYLMKDIPETGPAH
jgi:hypothetical protein